MSQTKITHPIAALIFALAASCATNEGDGVPLGDDGKADDLSTADGGSIPDAETVVMSMYVHTSDTLFVVDDANFDLTEIGPFDSTNSMMDMAVTPDGEIWTISFSAVFRIDASTGRAERRVDVPYGNVGMTFLPDGTLLAADNAGGVRVIDPVSGGVTELGTFGNGYALAGDLVAVAGGTMYGIADQGPAGDEAANNVLLTVETTTGAATAIGPIGYSGVFGIAVANDHVYAFTRTGEIIEIDPVTGAGTLVRSYPDVSFWGAGVTPRAVID